MIILLNNVERESYVESESIYSALLFYIIFNSVFNYFSKKIKYYFFEKSLNYLIYCTTKYIFLIVKNKFIKPKLLQLSRCFGVAG